MPGIRGSGAFRFPTVLNVQSEIIYFNNEDILAVEVFVTEELNAGQIIYSIGYGQTEGETPVFEELSRTFGELSGVRHTLITPGRFMYWKARGRDNATIRRIQIRFIRG